jgi:hypothetical protein
MENIYYVYIYRDPKNNIPFYVGKGKNNRIFDLLKESKSNNIEFNYLKHKKVREILSKDLEPLIEYHSRNLSEIQAYKLEEKLIKKYGRICTNNGCLTNLTSGGEGIKNITEDARKKMSHNKGKKFSDETKKKMSENNIMNIKKVFEIWVEKYGLDEAIKKENERRKKIGTYVSNRYKNKKLLTGKVYKYDLNLNCIVIYENKYEAYSTEKMDKRTLNKYLTTKTVYKGHYFSQQPLI